MQTFSLHFAEICKIKKMLCQHSQSLISVKKVQTPVGIYAVDACDKGVHTLTLVDNNLADDQNLDPNTKVDIGDCYVIGDEEKEGNQKPINEAVDWILMYFKNPKDLKTIPPICFSSNTTEFERKVWNTLAECSPFGTRLSYAELAAKIENPKASRAVGTAMKKNPVPLIVPCHRVVRSDGKLGNYSGGKLNNVKEWLLNHETTLN